MQEVIMEKKYEKIIERVKEIKNEFIHLELTSGERFNIFNILGLNSNEISHSRILADLLNIKGSHGQGEKYLKLFIDQLIELPTENQFHEESPHLDIIKKFQISSSRVIIEKSIGIVDYELGSGGRIDILLTDGHEFIIIENKIYAVDQPQQLLRYKNFQPTKDTPILYLNLFGSDASEHSKSNDQESLKLKTDYISISYSSFIKEWLESCINKSIDHPAINEILRQYLNLILQLTNQTINNKMSKELATYLASNYEEFDSIIKVKNEVYSLIIEKSRKVVESICDEKGFELIFDMKPEVTYTGFIFGSTQLKSQNIQIAFEWNGGSFYFGFLWLDKNGYSTQLKNRLQELFKFQFINCKETVSWPVWCFFSECPNWNQFYSLVSNDEFQQLIEEKIDLLIKISNQLDSEKAHLEF
jgi:hypothetical protein